MVYQDRFGMHLLQLFAQQENSKWFSIISAIIVKSILLPNRRKHFGNDLFVFRKLPLPSIFLLAPLHDGCFEVPGLLI